MKLFNRSMIWLIFVLVLVIAGSCSKDRVTVAGKGRKGSSGLKPGINYMQPMRWRMTYKYRVQEITPKVRFISPRAMPGFPGINAVGAGNYEVWFVGPREGEEIHDVELVQALPQPNSISEGTETEPVFYYYNFSPGGQLPDQISATISWEFTTYERYTHWAGMEVGEYDKQSELYKTYTKEEDPIDFEREMTMVAKNIQKQAGGDPMKTATGCYNFIVANFTYDWRQSWDIAYSGIDAMPNASLSWHNKQGICDEFATVFCSMMRSVGIPARPVAGFCHTNMLMTYEGMDLDLVSVFTNVERKHGPYFEAGGHAWAEYYLPNIGWVPMDPTWGDNVEIIEPYFSRIGNNRDIPTVDYYNGKMDPYRIALFKDWNYTLDPVPVTPGASPVQDWMMGHTERTNGVHKMLHGWEGVKSTGFYGYHRSAKYAGFNIERSIEALGPIEPKKLTENLAAIKESGQHYLRVPSVKASWPMATLGPGFEKTMQEMVENIEKEFPDDEKKKKSITEKLLELFNPQED